MTRAGLTFLLLFVLASNGTDPDDPAGEGPAEIQITLDPQKHALISFDRATTCNSHCQVQECRLNL